MSRVFLLAAEPSGDRLGARLMAALKRKSALIEFSGVGGDAMISEGLMSLYPMEDLGVFGFADIVASYSRLRARLRDTVDAIVGKPPDAIILIDSFGFSFRVAKAVRAKLPDIPIIKYVSPQVWVWRAHRAKAMRPYFDHTLALFPFEPEVHRKLGGPACTYVGHPLLEEVSRLKPSAEELKQREQGPPLAIVMPGSRRSELGHLAQTFGEALGKLRELHGPFEMVLPTLPSIEPAVRAAVTDWPVQPKIVVTENEKFSAMRRARFAIAASGTATLELALARIPHVGAYRVRWWEAAIGRMLIRVKMALLPNILLNERVVPELLQEHCTAGEIEAAVSTLIADTPDRLRQLEAFERLDAVLATPEPPSGMAAAMVLKILAENSAKKP